MDIGKRKEYINWEEYFMGLALLSKERSKDPVTQVGACIVANDNRVLSLGYNGMPCGINDNDLPWGKVGEFVNTKYAYVCHAELNAILNYKGMHKELDGATIYVTLFPCNECTKAIIQTGIKKIIYYDDKYHNSSYCEASKNMLDKAGVIYEKYKPDNRNKNINMNI